jgi:flagellar protein FlaI
LNVLETVFMPFKALSVVVSRVAGFHEEMVLEPFPFISTTKPLPKEGVVLEPPRNLPNNVVARLAILPNEGKGLYYIEEPELTEEEGRAYQVLVNRLQYVTKLEPGLGPDAYTPEILEGLIVEKAREVSEEYGVAGMHELTKDKLVYYIKRDLLGYGPINPLMTDDELEDVLVAGYDKPFIVVDRKWADLDWLETNLVLTHDQQDQLARRLALMGKSTLSIAFPKVQTMLPSHDRLAATYRYEVSPLGTSLSIRKFRKEPLTIPQLMAQSMLTPVMAAYLWEIVEERGVVFVIGLPGSGKTVLCNALSILLKPQFHPVTIEDFPELNLPQEQKQSLTARRSRTIRSEGDKHGEQAGDVSQVELLRHSLRIRPDFLIVGEILTEEAPVMFQAINTGLGGQTSFHAANVHAAVTRLIEKTIGVDPAMLQMIDAVVLVNRIRHPLTGETVRRIISIDEIIEVGKYNNVFSWSPAMDTFSRSDSKDVVNSSRAMQRIRTRRGWSDDQLADDLLDKAHFLDDALGKHIERFADFSQAVKKFYAGKVRPLTYKAEVEAKAVKSVEPQSGNIEDVLLDRLSR